MSTERPILTEGKYCYNAAIKRTSYESNIRGFSLGEPDMHNTNDGVLDIYSGELQQGYGFVNTNPPCGAILRISIRVTGLPEIDSRNVNEAEFDLISCIKEETADGDKYTVKYRAQQEASDGHKLVILRCLGSSGFTGRITNGKIFITATAVEKTQHINDYSTSTVSSKTHFVWNERCLETTTKKIKVRELENQRIIIYEQEDGFWKIVTETIPITVKIVFKPYWLMGGAFKNWLVSSGFEKSEHTYTYERNGELIKATTITYPKPTGKAGRNQPWRPATSFNGEFVCMQPGDSFSVWYYEDKWVINNAIYAKNFQSDSKAEGTLINKGDLRFKMNYIPAFAKIECKRGKVDYQYVNGGFAQVDATSYTGMAIILNFQCTGKKFYTQDDKQPQDMNIDDYICYIGGPHVLGHKPNYVQGVCLGFAAGFEDVIESHNMTISYTVMRPSDPEFITGGDMYQQSITSGLEASIRDLQDQINSLRAELNIQQVTSAIFTAITSLGDLPDLFSNITKVFSKLKENLSKLKSKKTTTTVKPIKATKIIDKFSAEVPNVTIANRMPEEIELGIIYNSMRKRDLKKQQQHDFSAFSIATETELPYIQSVETLTPSFKKYLNERGLLVDDDFAVQFDPMNSTFSTLRKKHAEILNYKIDPDLAHEVLSQMSTSATRSLFSLNVRKQISINNNFTTPTYSQLVERILDDKQILDVLGKMNKDSVGDMFNEFLERISNMLSQYV